MGRNNGTVPRAIFKDRKKERKIEKKEAVRRNFHDALPNLHLREHYDIFLVWPTRQLRIEKGTGAEMRPAIASGIVTRDAPVSYWSTTVPEVFAKVNSVQSPSRFYSNELLLTLTYSVSLACSAFPSVTFFDIVAMYRP